MSYDILKDKNRRDTKSWNGQQQLLEDVERGVFLRALDRAAFEVTDFEARFIESFLTANQLNWWTEKRRAACDQMRKSYGGRL